MAGFKLRYCSDCGKATTHTIETYPDGTMILECLLCGNREPVKLGIDYQRVNTVTSEDTSAGTLQG